MIPLGRFRILMWCLIAWGSVLARPLHAFNVNSSHTQRDGNAEAVVVGENREADHVETPLSGTITVILRVEGGAELEVEPVVAVTGLADWRERRREKATFTPRGADGMGWEQRFFLEPNRPGDLSLELVSLRYREKSGTEWKKTSWKEVPVKVTTEIANADPNQLRDIPPPEPVSDSRSDSHWLAWSGVALLAAALVIGAWEIKRRTGGTKPVVAPAEWALTELDLIERMHLPTDSDGIRHLALVSEVARRYFERQYQLKAPGKTTAEFLEALRQGAHLKPEQLAVLRDTLDRCDLAKFARVFPTAEECDALVGKVRALVKETNRPEAP
jgi:hypothetical protein